MINDTPLSSPQPETASANVAPAFVCDCGEGARSACQGEPFFREHEGKRFCVLHYPGADKLEAFHVALKRKLDAKDFDFRGVWFPEEVNFRNVEFSAEADFSGTTFSEPVFFSGATFSAKASFSGATFSASAVFHSATFSVSAVFHSATFSADADFLNATFEDANFSRATFSAETCFCKATFSATIIFCDLTFGAYADFQNATFSKAVYFDRATFSAKATFGNSTFKSHVWFKNVTFSAEADFSGATFSAEADFSGATFKNYVSFAGSNEEKVFGEKSRLDFQHTHIEKPERVSFHTLDLKPHWFINADCRKFEFTDCDWNHNLKQELKGACKAGIEASHRLLAITYRQLADNAEANHRYHEASNFRYNAFEARRIEKFWGFVPWRLDWWYWLASGYGESVGRAFVVFVALFALFAFGYGVSGFDQSGKGTAASVTQSATIQPDTEGKPLDLRDAFIYSFYVTILQKPEPKPLTRTAKILVGLETVLGPAQAALLALAVRRRFMR